MFLISDIIAWMYPSGHESHIENFCLKKNPIIITSHKLTQELIENDQISSYEEWTKSVI